MFRVPSGGRDLLGAVLKLDLGISARLDQKVGDTPDDTAQRRRHPLYEYFDHTADVGVQIRAADLETLLSDAGIALFGLIVEDPAQVRPDVNRTFHVAGNVEEADYLLFDWLNELLRLFEVTGLVFCRFDVTLSTDGVSATGWGEPLDPQRHGLGNEVKAVTYHALRAEQTPDGWWGEVILDI